ncbi:MAG TPA: hypothetical protein VG308_18075 [Stellaceae bacterium]|jgi:hypothetical protein|nr:hypothetical protein [Stellaceae bacterium]
MFADIAIWWSDYPHYDTEDVWEALDLMAKYEVPEPVQRDMLGNSARRLYGIEPLLTVKERVEDYQPRVGRRVANRGQRRSGD